jgi:inner membrane protein
MLFYTHILLGVVLFILTKGILNGGNEIIFFLLLLLGSILPDIDADRSKINQWSGFIGRIISIFVKHRGIFHSIILHLLIFVIVSYFFSVYYAQGLFLGYIAHLIGDGVTLRGVKVFYPFSEFKIKGPIRVGGIFEWLIMGALIVFIAKQFF